jgi:hypothetical protein
LLDARLAVQDLRRVTRLKCRWVPVAMSQQITEESVRQPRRTSEDSRFRSGKTHRDSTRLTAWRLDTNRGNRTGYGDRHGRLHVSDLVFALEALSDSGIVATKPCRACPELTSKSGLDRRSGHRCNRRDAHRLGDAAGSHAERAFPSPGTNMLLISMKVLKTRMHSTMGLVILLL